MIDVKYLVNGRMSPIVVDSSMVLWASPESMELTGDAYLTPFEVTINSDDECVIQAMDGGGLWCEIAIRTTVNNLSDLETIILNFEKMLREMGQ